MGENRKFKLNLQKIEQKYLKINKKRSIVMAHEVQTSAI
jgi:hypothetical protein